MFAIFRDRILAVHPQFEVVKPCFEHVMAGPFKLLELGLPAEEVYTQLTAAFPGYVI